MGEVISRHTVDYFSTTGLQKNFLLLFEISYSLLEKKVFEGFLKLLLALCSNTTWFDYHHFWRICPLRHYWWVSITNSNLTDYASNKKSRLFHSSSPLNKNFSWTNSLKKLRKLLLEFSIEKERLWGRWKVCCLLSQVHIVCSLLPRFYWSSLYLLCNCHAKSLSLCPEFFFEAALFFVHTLNIQFSRLKPS